MVSNGRQYGDLEGDAEINREAGKSESAERYQILSNDEEQLSKSEGQGTDVAKFHHKIQITPRQTIPAVIPCPACANKFAITMHKCAVCSAPLWPPYLRLENGKWCIRSVIEEKEENKDDKI